MKLSRNGWAHRVAAAEQFPALIGKSQRGFVAAEDGKVIGFAPSTIAMERTRR